eukprot:6175604-Pleurochrysis_carterae.AAC.1
MKHAEQRTVDLLVSAPLTWYTGIAWIPPLNQAGSLNDSIQLSLNTYTCMALLDTRHDVPHMLSPTSNQLYARFLIDGNLNVFSIAVSIACDAAARKRLQQ